MNYLGHAYLSFNNAPILAGNMIGDYVKGSKVLRSFPEGIRQGIVLHRKIDAFADAHPATAVAKEVYRPHYRLYAGAFVDSLYDHFLAKDTSIFTDEHALANFARQTYGLLQTQQEWLSERFLKILPYMVGQNWLYNYRTLDGMANAFAGLVHRAKYLNDSDTAHRLLVQNYALLEAQYSLFIKDITRYVKKQLNDG
ncbi:MAG: ACP phosphodiesterase [Edaphocola sp.]